MNTKYLSIRYILALALSSLLFSCSVMDDIHNELDETAPQPKASYSYTLVTADYIGILQTAMAEATTAADSALIESINSRNALPKADAEKYILRFLTTQHPSLMAGSVCKLTYKIQDTVKIEGEYTIQVTEQTTQFVRTTAWFTDPTVRLKMATSDYQMIVDSVKQDSTKKKYLIDDNAEYYYGASANTSNFDLRLVGRITGKFAQEAFIKLKTEKDPVKTEKDQIALTYKRLDQAVGLIVKAKYPNAVAKINGIDVLYEISVATYENDWSRRTHTITYQCTKSAPNPEFTFVKRSVK